jgi:hypothetical protein
MNLEITFSGLCNFVPIYNKDILERLWVLLINARNIDDVPGGPASQDCKPVIFEHWAFLRYPLRSVADGSPSDAMGVWSLHGCDLEVLDENGDVILSGLSLASPPLSNPEKPVLPGEERSFSWLAKTGRLQAKHRRVLGDCLLNDMTQVPTNLVSARVLVTAGEVYTKKIVTYPGTRTPIVWEFDPPSIRQALAEEVALKVDIPGDVVIFRRTNRLSGTSHDLALGKEVVGKLRVEVMNLEPEGILGVGDRERPARIEEFRWFYRVSADPTAPFPVPVTDPSAGGNPYCPMSWSQAQ